MSLFSSLIKSAGSDIGKTIENATGIFSGKSSVKGSVSSTASSASDINDDGKGWVTAPFQVRLGNDFTSRYAALSWLSPGDKVGETLAALKVNTFHVPDSIVAEERINKLYGLDEEEGAELLRQHNYQDTRVGGNDAFNNVWAFGEDDDISRGVFTIDKDKGIGMGRVYASTTQQNQVIAWFTFGIPRFSKFSAFYEQAFDSDLIDLNTKGFNPSILLGAIFDIAALSIEIPLLPIKWLNQQRLDRYKIGRFYELRACMHLYYKYVDSMLAQWLVSAGLYMNGSGSDAGRDIFASPDSVPDALSDGASIWDIIQRKALNLGASNEKITEYAGTLSNDPNEKDKTKLLKKSTRVTDSEGNTTLELTEMKGSIRKMEAEANRVAKEGFGSSGDLTAQLFENSGKNDPTSSTPNNAELKAYLEKLEKIQREKLSADSNASGANSVFDDNYGVSWSDKFQASMFGATQYIGFRIDRSVDASESFSNSTSPSEFAQTFNDGVRNANNQQLKSLLSGDTGIPIVDGLLSQAKGIFQAATDTIEHMTGINFFSNLGSAVVSGAYLDIPEQYAGSDFGKSHSINLQLRSPYGDMISIYQSIIVPLSMILAGCLPRAGGDNSYVQPFLCRVYCKGMFSVPMGIIDSVNVKRGSSEFGWTYQNLPTCVDVSISIKDMSPVMYMTMADGIFTSIIAQDSAFKEYMLTLSGVGLWERLSTWHRWQRNITYIARNLRNVIGNPNYWSHSISQWQIVQTAAGIWPKSTVQRN